MSNLEMMRLKSLFLSSSLCWWAACKCTRVRESVPGYDYEHSISGCVIEKHKGWGLLLTHTRWAFTKQYLLPYSEKLIATPPLLYPNPMLSSMPVRTTLVAMSCMLFRCSSAQNRCRCISASACISLYCRVEEEEGEAARWTFRVTVDAEIISSGVDFQVGFILYRNTLL